jgi:NAD-dependent SIR2 family protein deacetylase
MITEETTRTITQLLADADHLLIGAGAGLSADAGLDYTDTKLFAELFPGLAKQGYKHFYDMFVLIGSPDWSEAEKWGYLANQVHYVRFRPNRHPTYTRLLDLVKAKDYFVITTNADDMFSRNGFDPARIYTPQGSYSRLQCLTPCWRETWPSQPVIEKILPVVDPHTHVITDPDAVPSCPNCGGPVFMNVRGGNWFIDDPDEGQKARYIDWLQETLEARLLILEFGVGFNTPGVVRWPMEQITYSHPDATLVRVNSQRPQVPEEIAERSISLENGAREVIDALWDAVGSA